MKKKYILLLLSFLILTSCASKKLSKTVWYNITMVQGSGIMGNVGTSLVFNSDSSIIIYKGISMDTTVIVSPYIFAYGQYQIDKAKGRTMQISISATQRDGKPYVYMGEYNKKEKLMRLSTQNSELKETYIWNPEVKVKVN